MPRINVHGNSISYEERGVQDSDQPPLMFIHGFPHNRHIWDAQVASLCNDRRVIAIDLPGFGDSIAVNSFTISSLADVVHDALKQLNALPCVLCGLSMGGCIALAFSKKYANDLTALILCDTRSEGDTPEAREGREKMIQLAKTKGGSAIAEAMLPKQLSTDTIRNQPQIASKFKKIMEDCPVETIVTALEALRDRRDYAEHLPSIVVPTLIVVGQDDAITPPSMAEALKRSIPQSTLVKIPNAGHLAPMEQPELVNQAISSFLRR